MVAPDRARPSSHSGERFRDRASKSAISLTFVVSMVALSCGASSRRDTESSSGGQAGNASEGGSSGDVVTGGVGAQGGSSGSTGSSGTGQTGGTGSDGGGMGGTATVGGAGGAGAGGEAGESMGTYVAVAAHSGACALRLDGSIQCWGEGLAGAPRGNGGYQRVALAQYGGCGLKESDGRTECFRVVTNSFQPPPIPLAGTARYVEIGMAGTGLLCGLTDETGEVLCQGEGGPVAPVEGTFSQFSVAYGSSSTYSGCALSMKGSAVCWMWDTDVVLTQTPEGSFRRISVGGQHACAIDQASSLVCWGSNDFGESSPPSGAFDAVSSGDAHSCALTPSGLAECWGDDALGQSTPPSGVTFSQISAGRTATCGVTTDRWIRCWGDLSAWSALPPEG